MELQKLAKTAVLSIGIVVMLSLTGSRLGWGQGAATGGIAGAVLDASGAVIPNAAVQVIDAATGQPVRRLTTSSSGNFRTTLLPPGAYTIVVNAPNFGEARAEGISVRVTETTTLNVTLKPVGLSQKVEVTGQVVSVNTEDATTGQTIEHAEVGGLPLATRNFQQLLTLSTGASSSLNNSEQLGRGTARGSLMRVNGPNSRNELWHSSRRPTAIRKTKNHTSENNSGRSINFSKST